MEEESTASTGPDVHTYHCICSNLLFAAAQPLSSLTRRSSGTDKAYILPLPELSRPTVVEADAGGGGGNVPGAAEPQPASGGYARLVSTALDRKPLIVRSSDGFEKRYLQRCSRCNIVIAYQLDWSQFPSPVPTPEGGTTSTGHNSHTGRREDLVYLLPGGVLSTNEMIQGAVPGD